MTGYRQTGFDPNAYEQPGPPLRPYNWVQWLGVASAVAGLALYLAHFAGWLGWIRPVVEGTTAALALTIVGVVLINSRRGPSRLVGSEQLAQNRRTLILTAAICAAILGAALVIKFSGA